MINRELPRRLLWYLCGGFLVLIALTWADELLSLPSLLFGGEPHPPNWRESAMETVAALAVGVPLYIIMRRIVVRLYYLEGFLRICAWCKKINLDDQWLPVDEYFKEGFDTDTTHGMCPTCFENMKRKLLSKST
jgi:hypothetical protein